MKYRLSRTHTMRPQDYESVMINGAVEIDLDNEADADFRSMTDTEIGAELSEVVDSLVDKDVERALSLDGPHTVDTHLWVYYGKD